MESPTSESEQSFTLYRVLGVERTADSSQIKNAYKMNALVFHPDRTKGAERQFDAVRKAYTILSNKKTRRLYDMCGDGILPLLSEERYYVYLDCFLSKYFLVLTVAMTVLALGNLVFLPHAIMAKSYGYIPAWVLLFLPFALAWVFLFVVSVKLIATFKKQRNSSLDTKIVVHILIKSFFSVALPLAFLAYLDDFVTQRALLGTYLLFEAYSLGMHLQASKEDVERWHSLTDWEQKCWLILRATFRPGLVANIFLRAFFVFALLQDLPLSLVFSAPVLYIPVQALWNKMKPATCAIGCVVAYPYLLLCYFVIAEKFFIFTCMALSAVVLGFAASLVSVAVRHVNGVFGRAISAPQRIEYQCEV